MEQHLDDFDFDLDLDFYSIDLCDLNFDDLFSEEAEAETAGDGDEVGDGDSELNEAFEVLLTPTREELRKLSVARWKEKRKRRLDKIPVDETKSRRAKLRPRVNGKFVKKGTVLEL